MTDEPGGVAEAAGEPDRQPVRRSIRGLRDSLSRERVGSLPVLLALGLVWIFFYSQEPAFLSARNLSNIILQISVTGTIAIGTVLILLIAEIDLSVGSVAGVTAAILAVLVVNHGWPWWAGIIVMLASGVAIGVFNGLCVTVLGIPSFVVTLAALLAFLGVQLHILGDAGTINVFEPHISAIATTYLPSAWGLALGITGPLAYTVIKAYEETRRRGAGLQRSSELGLALKCLAVFAGCIGGVVVLNRFQGVPTSGVIFVSLVAIVGLATTRTRFGRHIFAVGGNPEAARRASIKVGQVRVAVFALSGLFAAVGGLIAVSRGAAASTQTGGGTLLLEVIAAAVIGGTSLFGGYGTVWAALLGALVIGSVSNGLDLLGQPPDVKYIVQGAVLLVAVAADSLVRRGERRG
jgi:D-xylose transport system permease protein